MGSDNFLGRPWRSVSFRIFLGWILILIYPQILRKQFQWHCDRLVALKVYIRERFGLWARVLGNSTALTDLTSLRNIHWEKAQL